MKTTVSSWFGLVGLCALTICSLGDRGIAAQTAENKVTPGELVIDHPTLINLGFEWLIDGDDNRNASVEVSYRKQGETAMEDRACRCCGCRASESISKASWMSSRRTCSPAASSIWSRTRAYEARFVLTDPDGVTGAAARTATKTVTVRTRPEPKPFAGGKRLSRLSARLQRHEAGAGVRRRDVRLQLRTAAAATRRPPAGRG